MPHTPLKIAFRRPWPGTRRGLKLWFLALIIGLKGGGYATGHNSSATESALQLITDKWSVPLSTCGWVIIALCVSAAWTSYCHHGRDRYGYGLLFGFCAGWAAAYAVTPLFLNGPTYAWQGTLSWLLIGGMVLLCASDPDPKP